MPPPKKNPKIAAEKKSGHHGDKHHHANDLRRAYEHMGRVAVLQQTLKSSTKEAIPELIKLAQQAIQDEHSKDAADLLRASEHLSFATLAGEVSDVLPISAELKQSITKQFDELSRRADEHWEEEEHSGILTAIYRSSRDPR